MTLFPSNIQADVATLPAVPPSRMAGIHRTRVVAVAAPLLVACLLAGCKRDAPAESGAALTSTQAWFEEVSSKWQIEFTHESGHDGNFYAPEAVAGGVCILDYDSDGNFDVYFVQSGSLDPAVTDGPGNVLYRNLGGGSFADVTLSAGVGDTGYGMGCSCGDYDGDGDTDLYVTNYGPNVLYRNNRDGTFTDVTEAAGLSESGWGSGSAFVDYDGDGDEDLYVVNYTTWSRETERPCYSLDRRRDYCSPKTYNAPAVDALYRNEGNGTFVEVTESAGINKAFGNGLGVACADFNRDGWVDIYVANDAVDNQLWINDGKGHFTDEGLFSGCAVNGYGMPEGSMGVVAVDAGDDGDWDLFMSHWRNETNTFYRNLGGTFEDATAQVGLAAPSRPFTGFGLGFADFNHDGLLDAFVANGGVVLSEPLQGEQDPYAEPNQVFRGVASGRFKEVLPRGGTDPPLIATSRGTAMGDLDNDGAVDLVVVNKDGRAHVLRNVVGASGRWIMFRVVNRNGADALGAELDIVAGETHRRRIVFPSYGYCSSQDPRVHCGLGRVERVDSVQVRWPGGSIERFGPYSAGAVHELREGLGRRAEAR